MKKSLYALLLLPLLALADVTYTYGPWVLYRSGTAQTPTHATAAACDTALKAQPVTSGTVTLRCQQTITAKYVAASSSSSAASSSSSSSSTSSASSSSSSAAATWAHCANEGSLCAFTGSRSVRFGVGTTWDTRTYTGGVTCNTTYFADPAPGQTKTCQLLSSGSSSSGSSSSTSSSSTSSASSSSSSVATASVSLTWTAPTQNTDGAPIGTITGYRIHYGTSLSLPMQSVVVGPVTSLTINNLATGQTWYFRASTITEAGEGSPSNAASKAL